MSLADRLKAARQSRFVGRLDERNLFQSALTASELPFIVLYIFGPGGVGKSTLLREFADISKQAKLATVMLDGRDLDPSPDGFRRAFQQAADSTQVPHQFTEKPDERSIVFIDTYERLMPIDGWLREAFLPELPDNVLVVLAGRRSPSVEWRTDPGWQLLMHVMPLRNLSPAEGESYLERRQIPAEQHGAVLDFTHGHPLALALVADAFAQQPEIHFQPEESVDVIQALVERFSRNVPTPQHRAALEACALVRLTTEPLLAAMLGESKGKGERTLDARTLFTWLYSLSFIEGEPGGLYLHDLAKEALAADLRWRNPDQYADLHRRARNYYMSHLYQGDGKAQRQILFDYIYLHRSNAMVRPYFEWQEGGSVYTDRMRAADEQDLLAMAEKHEGPAARQIATHWLARQPQNVSVFRDSIGALCGFLAAVALHETTAADRDTDPAIKAAWRYLRDHAPLRQGESATHFRFWMAGDTYQSVSPTQSRIFLNMVQHYLTTPRLAYTFIVCADPSFWTAVFTYADLHRLEAADFSMGGREYGVYGHDWRAVPPTAWLDLLAERETALKPESITQPTSRVSLLVLSRDEFETALREALGNFAEARALAQNPLLNSRLVLEITGGKAAKMERVACLQHLIRETAESLQTSRRGRKAYHALYHAYLQPARTQERAAEILDIPYGTFRRHLKTGLEEVTRLLWQRELGA